MCISLNNEDLIKIQAKTDEFKYEFLRRYIPLWNKIICKGRRVYRAIIDTHAGSGYVKLNNKKKYGSSLLFLKQTALIQEALDFYFIEQKKNTYSSLKDSIENIAKKGFYFSGKDKGYSQKVIYEEGLPKIIKTPKFKPVTKHPNQKNIHIYNGDSKKIIDMILPLVDRRPSFFFIDPCGKCDWELIFKIISNRMIDDTGKIRLNENGDKIQGTELLINWSWEAISRNKTIESSRNQIFMDIYGLDYNQLMTLIKKEKTYLKKSGIRYSEYNLYLEIYMNQLRKYFNYVYDISILGIKSSQNPIYCLIFCTNNESAKKLFLNIEMDLNRKKKSYLALKRLSSHKKEFTYEKYNEFIKKNKKIDDYL